ncbi:Cobalt ECF transporter T component CbiQ [Acididesulfobacillus acetoxydans]|uniref:Cobalt ECF transporter T component CbiQ n=1 Tax=Acididesulfobacillus acetoxydans TaxID=1561005 RepID=A0A8S0X5D6_9FIRM|nr:cobalt ECF transporter T component CbiQ [Acididesulfobacillus acetoxydans]CAA7601540.1 Cobalt ECF transporter T component CbiQ [Acididesulfobacillus acetoxydans]CEJ07027.1 Predicted cobalt transport system, permease subunit [Acididesulfobacillus acetoxydans]
MELAVLDKIAAADSPMHRWDGRVKTVLYLLAIIVATVLTRWYLVAGLWLMALASYRALNLPWRHLLLRLSLPFGIAWLVFLSLIFTNGSRVLLTVSLGPLVLTAYREGLALGFLILLRIMAAVTLASVLSLCTPMIEILETLRLCKVPNLMIDLAAMMYRYVFILAETGQSMRRAQVSRMGEGGSWRQQARDVGKVAGYVLTKSLDRSIRIYKAMLSRGYEENSKGADFFTAPIPAGDWQAGLLGGSLLVLLVGLNLAL